MLNRVVRKIRAYFMSDEEYAREIGVKFGDNCVISSRNFSSEPYLISLGNRVRVSPNVCFFTHGGVIPFREKNSKLDFFGKIIIGDKVHLGHGALIMAGVTIGSNCIIGAGSVVTRSVPDNSIVAGNPARIVGKTDQFLHKISQYDVGTKGMSYLEKKNILEQLDEECFIKQPMMKSI